MDVIGLALAGAETDFGRSVRDGAASGHLDARPLPHPRLRRSRGRHHGRFRERSIFASARIRRHAQRVHRSHEQSRGGGRAGSVRIHARIGARSHHRHRHRKRNLLSRRQRFIRRIAPARFSSDRIIRDLRSGVSGGQDCSGSMPKPWRARRASRAASHRDCWNAGWMERKPSSCIPDGRRKAGSQRRCWRARASPDPPRFSKGAGDFSPRTCRMPTRIATSGASSITCTARLGEHWESRNSSFKPFPAAHVIHPYISAMLRLRAKHGIQPGDVERIECPVTAFIVGIVCEPTEEKFAPASDSHGRVSLQYSLAEALYLRGPRQTRIPERRISRTRRSWRWRAACTITSIRIIPAPAASRARSRSCSKTAAHSKKWKNTIAARPKIR